MSTPRDRVISVVLSEPEWKAFLDTQPQPVAWLRERIAEAIAAAATASTSRRPADAAYTTSAKSH